MRDGVKRGLTEALVKLRVSPPPPPLHLSDERRTFLARGRKSRSENLRPKYRNKRNARVFQESNRNRLSRDLQPSGIPSVVGDASAIQFRREGDGDIRQISLEPSFRPQRSRFVAESVGVR